MLLSIDVEEPGQDLVSESASFRPSRRRAFALGLAAGAAGVFAFVSLATAINAILLVHTNHSVLNANPLQIDEASVAFVPSGRHPKHHSGNDLRTSPLIKPGSDAARLSDDVSMLMWTRYIPKWRSADDASSEQATTDDRNPELKLEDVANQANHEGSKPETGTRQGPRKWLQKLKFWRHWRWHRNLIKIVAKRDDLPMRTASSQMVALSRGHFCDGLPGAMPNGEVFDPAEMMTEEKVRLYRDYELAHGRVGMLASLGFLLQDGFHPLIPMDGNLWDQPWNWPPYIQIGLIIASGICEKARFSTEFFPLFDGHHPWALKDDYEPGNLGFDPLGIKPTDPDELRKMQERELWNGRFAMMAAGVFMAQEAHSGTTWMQNDIDLAEHFAGLLSGSAGSS